MVCEAFTAPLYAPLADRLGRRPVLLVCLLFWGLFAVCFGVVQSVWATIVMRGTRTYDESFLPLTPRRFSPLTPRRRFTPRGRPLRFRVTIACSLFPVLWLTSSDLLPRRYTILFPNSPPRTCSRGARCETAWSDELDRNHADVPL
jgi:MFS family permease